MPEQISRRWRGSDGRKGAAEVGLVDGEVVQLVPVQAGGQPGQCQLVRTCYENDGLGDLGRIGESEANGGVNSLGGLQPRGEVFTDCDVEALHLRHGQTVARPLRYPSSPPETVPE